VCTRKRVNQRTKVALISLITLISTSRPEPARNKPLIVGRCAGVKTRLFLDSEAEMNVIDSEYLKGLMDKQLCIKFTKGFSQ